MSRASEYTGSVLGLLDDVEPFQAKSVYIAEGDCIEFIAAPDDFRGERIDDLVTVYISEETGEVVGSLIKGVSKFFTELRNDYPGVAIEICDGKVELRHLFRWRLWSSKDKLQIVRYKKLVDIAERSKAETELQCC